MPMAGGASRRKALRLLHVLSLLSIIAVVCAACSATNYSGETDKFAKATTTTQTAFVALQNQERDSVVQRNIYQATGDPDNNILLNSGCGLPGPDGACVINVAAKGGQPVPLAADIAAPKALKMMQSIVDYADGLQKLTASTDIDELNSNIGDLNTSINGLATQAAIAAGGKIGSGAGNVAGTIGPIETIVQLVGVNYLEARREQAFRETVTAANTPLATVADAMAEQARLLQTNILQNGSATLKFRQGELAEYRKAHPLDGPGQRSQAEALMRDADSLNEIASADPAKPFVTMKAAHAALFAAVRTPGISISELKEKATAFYNAARELYNAIQASRKD